MNLTMSASLIKRLLIILPIVVVLTLVSLFMPARRVSIEGVGTLSFDTTVTISVGSEVAHAAPGWTFVAHRGSANNKTAGTSISMNPNANLAVGRVIVVRCVSNNPPGASGETNYHTVSSIPSNAWTKIREQTRSPGGTGNDGVTASLWICQITSQITTSDTITLTISRSRTAKAIGADEFSIGTGNSISVVGDNAAVGNNRFPSVNLSGLTSAEYLWLGHIGIEGPNSDGFTQDADYANNTSFGTMGSGAASNVASRFGSRVHTGTSDTYNPTLGTSRDWVAILGAVQEIANVPDISNTPSSYNFGSVAEGATPSTGLAYFTVTNNSSSAVDITISGTDMTGGDTWTLSDDGNPGTNIYGLQAGLEGEAYTIIVKKNSPYNTLVSNLAASGTQRWGLQLYAPTTFSDGEAKTGTVTLTATF
jgi:hypothetical protein